ncbi:hypothetical protein M1432_03320 [Patescibacteria group bacterium]|nr:hypothetical protein [Patescibacteria group bacterium]
MSKKAIIIVAVIVIVAAALVVYALWGKQGTAPASSTGSTATSSGTLGGQIYANVAPQAVVPQNLPQTNPFGQ